MDMQPHIAIGAPAPAGGLVSVECRFLLRPTGRLMLTGRAPFLDTFHTVFPDNRLWMRWAGADRDDARIDIAWASWDAPSSTARVFAHPRVSGGWWAWALFRVAQVEGLVDVWLWGPEQADDSPADFLHFLAYADPSQSAENVGFSAELFPGRPQ